MTVVAVGPQESKGSTIKDQVPLIPHSTTVARQAYPLSSDNMNSTSKTTSSNRQAMASKPKLQKALHAPARNRQMIITPTQAVWPEPLLITARNDTPSGSYTRTIQSATSLFLEAMFKTAQTLKRVNTARHCRNIQSVMQC